MNINPFQINHYTYFFTILLMLMAWLTPVGATAYLAIGLIVVLGIPHGATDHLIFLHLARPFLGAKGLQQFYCHYLLLMVGYALVWWLSPALAFGIFLTVSVYHFGQSNWASVSFQNKTDAVLTYLCWGAFVLFMPILQHFDEAAAIIGSITRSVVPEISTQVQLFAKVFLLALNAGMIGLWRLRHTLALLLCWQELGKLFLLSILFWTTPLLLGFAVYFVFWHSLPSMYDQIQFFRMRRQHYTWRQYARHTLPLTLSALLGLAALLTLKKWLHLPTDVGTLFLFIAIITLPHILLMEQLYNQEQHSIELSVRTK